MDDLGKMAEDLNEATEKAGLLASQTLLQFDTMAQLQMQERKDLNELHMKEKESMRKRYGRIILGLVIVLGILIAGVVGSIFYITANYEFGIITTQSPTVEGNGRVIIEDGIHLDPNSLMNNIPSGD